MRNATNVNTISPMNVAVGSARPVLVNTQQRIFGEVINLIMEINDIKQAIQKEK